MGRGIQGALLALARTDLTEQGSQCRLLNILERLHHAGVT